MGSAKRPRIILARSGRVMRRGARRWPSTAVGALASAAMTLFYVMAVLGASRSIEHLADQVRTDWYLLLPIVAGFGVQAGLFVELRRRRRSGRRRRGAETGLGHHRQGELVFEA